APGNGGDFRAGGEIRKQDQIERFFVGECYRLFWGKFAAGEGGCDHALGVDATSIIPYLNADLVAGIIGVQPDSAHLWLALLAALFGRLNAMGSAVANELHQRSGDGFDDVAVNLARSSGCLEVNELILLLGRHARGQAQAWQYLV